MKLRSVGWIALLSVCLTIPAVFGAQPSHSIVGTWTGVDNQGVEGGFVFSPDGTADMLRGGESFRHTKMKDGDSLTYRFDATVTPIALDFLIKRGNGAQVSLPMIIEFIDDRTIRLRQSNGGPRPKDFKDAKPNELIVLHRPRPEPLPAQK